MGREDEPGWFVVLGCGLTRDVVARILTRIAPVPLSGSQAALFGLALGPEFVS